VEAKREDRLVQGMRLLAVPNAVCEATDAGKKSLSTDEGLPVCADKDLELFKLNEGHGHIRIEQPDLSIVAGDKVEIIPRHGCTTIPLFDHYHVIRNDCLEAVIEIKARGANQ